jgi:hypothetical protein
VAQPPRTRPGHDPDGRQVGRLPRRGGRPRRDGSRDPARLRRTRLRDRDLDGHLRDEGRRRTRPGPVRRPRWRCETDTHSRVGRDGHADADARANQLPDGDAGLHALPDPTPPPNPPPTDDGGLLPS